MNKYKEFIIITAIVLLPFMARLALAQSPSVAPTKSVSVTATPSNPVEKNILNLKEKIASKVSELAKSDTSISTGTITNINANSIDLQSGTKNISVSIDETVTVIYSVQNGKKISIKKSDLKKGEYLIVSGPHIEQTITANTIYRDTQYIITGGSVVNIDKDNFTVDVVTHDKEELTLRIEDSTKQQILDVKSDKITRSGFTKIRIGDTIHFVFDNADQKEKSISILRLLVVPQEYFSN